MNALTRPFGAVLIRKGFVWQHVEPEELARFLKAFKVDCVFDVGANAGQYGMRLRDIGYRGLIISFEPNPDAARKLRAEAAEDDRWIVKELALDEHSRPLTFNIMKVSEFSSLHEPDHSKTEGFLDFNRVERQIALVTETLETVFPAMQAQYQFRRPFLKMDTQGHDLAVAKGAGRFLSQFAGLQSELSLTTLYKDQPEFTEAIAFYRQAGFRLSALVPNTGGHFPDLNEIDCIMYNPAWWTAES